MEVRLPAAAAADLERLLAGLPAFTRSNVPVIHRTYIYGNGHLTGYTRGCCIEPYPRCGHSINKQTYTDWSADLPVYLRWRP
jgi:hypothetical protein